MQHLAPALLLCTLASTAFAGSDTCHSANGHEIHVTGSGTASLPPDQVSFTVGVESRSRNVAEAFRSNSEKANAIIATLKKIGVKKEEIHTSNLSIHSYSEHNDTAVTYIVSYQITVTRKDLTAIGELIQAAVEKGANQAGSLYFSVTNTSEARKHALQLAFDDAHDKAQQLARLAGKDLGEVVCITEQGRAIPQPFAYASKAESFAATPTIEPGTQQLSFSIDVIFEMK